MTTQTIQFDAPSISEIGSGTITAFLFSGTTLVATLASVTENGTLKGYYTATCDDIAAGNYRVVVKLDGYTVSEPHYKVDLVLAAGTYSAYLLSGACSGSGTNILYIPEDTTQPLFRVRLPGNPVDVAFNDVNLAISYRIETQATFTTLTMAAGTLATWITSTFIKEASGSAIYQLCLPAAAILSGKKTFLRLTYAGVTADATISATLGSGGSGSGTAGPGNDPVTIEIKDDGVPVEDVSVWISTDSGGLTVIAGTQITNALGKTTFQLTEGATYYLWAVKAGKISINGQSFVAEADT